MSVSQVSNLQTKLLPAICACVLVRIVVAGLWPFHAPRNAVSWLGEGNGLLFGSGVGDIPEGLDQGTRDHNKSGPSSYVADTKAVEEAQKRTISPGIPRRFL